MSGDAGRRGGRGWPCAVAAGGLVLLLVLIGVQHHRLRTLKFDDAWIHFRYAESIARGEGFVYNEGERVLGSGGPVWNVVLALLALATGPEALPDAAAVLNYLALLGCAGVLALALRRLVPAWLALVATAALLAQGPLLVSSVGGMETSLLCLLQFVTFLLLTQERFVAAGFAAGAAIGLRVESAALAGGVLLAALLYRPRLAWRTLAAAAVVPLALYLWVWSYFGSPLPTSTLAKKTVYVLPPLTAFAQCLEFLLEVFPLHRLPPFAYMPPDLARWTGVVVWLALIGAGVRFIRRTHPPAALVSLQVFGALAFYTLSNPLMFSWYACTFVPLATLLAILGLVEVLERVPALGTLRPVAVGVLVTVFSALPLKTFWLPPVPPEDARFSFDHPNARGSARTYQYANIARWLNARARADDRVCISEIGAFGYHWRGRILDGMGLVSPEVLRYHPLPESARPNGAIGAIPPRVVRDLRPEFVVSLDLFAGALFADPWFEDHYEQIGRWPWFGGPARWHDLPDSLWGASEMRAYRRRDARWNGNGAQR